MDFSNFSHWGTPTCERQPLRVANFLKKRLTAFRLARWKWARWFWEVERLQKPTCMVSNERTSGWRAWMNCSQWRTSKFRPQSAAVLLSYWGYVNQVSSYLKVALRVLDAPTCNRGWHVWRPSPAWHRNCWNSKFSRHDGKQCHLWFQLKQFMMASSVIHDFSSSKSPQTNLASSASEFFLLCTCLIALLRTTERNVAVSRCARLAF